MHASLPYTAVSLLPVGWWTTDLNLRLVSAVAPEELKKEIQRSGSFLAFDGDRALDLSYPQHPDVAAHLRARAGETVVWDAGTNGSLRACAAPLTAEDGRIIGVAGAVVDLSRFHKEEIRRRSAEQLLFSLMEKSGDAISLLDSGGRIIFANEHYYNAVGKDPMTVLGREEDLPVAGDSSPDSVSDGWECWLSLDKSKRFRSVRFTLEAPTGSAITCHVSRDVTPEFVVRERMEQLNSQYQTVFSENPRPMALIDFGLVITDVNGRFCSVLNASKEALLDSSFLDWVHPNSADAARSFLLGDETGDGPSVRTHLLFQTAQGRLIQAVIEARRSRDADDRASAMIFVEIGRWGSPGEPATPSLPMLDEVDQEILELLALGSGNSEIAATLCLSRQGLDYRIKKLRERMNAESRAALIARAYALGLFDPKQWPPRMSRSLKSHNGHDRSPTGTV